MNGAVRSWLPAGAVLPPVAKGAFMAMADGWSAAWFAVDPPRVHGVFVRVAWSGELRNTDWHCCDGGLAIGISAGGQEAIGAAVLDLSPDSPWTEADRALFVRIGGDCLDDLKRRAAMLFAGEAAAWRTQERVDPGQPVHRIRIADPHNSFTATIEVSADCFARFVKGKLAPVPRQEIGGGDAALSALPVTLAVAVGGCSVTVAELATLAQGDVLLLDRALEAPLPLMVAGAVARRGSCTLSQSDDRVALKITEALAG